jgi:hypothetical protein
MGKTFIVFFIILLLVHCKAGDSTNNQNNQKPVVSLTGIFPTSKARHMAPFILSANGTNFVPNSKIFFKGAEMQTTYISSTELSCQIGPNDTTGSSAWTYSNEKLSENKDETVQVFVRNPTADGGDSNSLEFRILDNPEFKIAVNLSDDPARSRKPAIAVDGQGNNYVVWFDDTNGIDGIYFRCSTDYGSSWEEVINYSDHKGSSWYPDVALDHIGNICVVWDEWIDKKYDEEPKIYFNHSTDGGATWGGAVNIYNDDWNSSADIAIDTSGNIYVIWHNASGDKQRIYCSRSLDNGTTWNDPVKISNIKSDRWVFTYPAIAVDNSGNINTVWHDAPEGNKEIFFSRSTNHGISWVKAVNISNNPGESENPSIEVDNAGNIYVVWRDDSHGNDQIYFSRSIDNGLTWNPFKNVSNNSGTSWNPAIAIDSVGNINVVWSDDIGGPREIHFRRSIDEGANWFDTVNISNISKWSVYPSIAVDNDGNINIVWGTSGLDVYFNSSK